mgnify:CR=1 FL=1
MSTIEAADLARIILDDTETDRHMDLYTLTVIEARTLAHAALAADRVEELADRLDDGHLRYLIRTALNGDDQ